MSVVRELGGVFAINLEQHATSDNSVAMPGAILIKGAKEIRVIQPSKDDPIYFSALCLWAHFGGDGAVAMCRDPRLPMFTRDALTSMVKLNDFFKKKIAS